MHGFLSACSKIGGHNGLPHDPYGSISDKILCISTVWQNAMPIPFMIFSPFDQY